MGFVQPGTGLGIFSKMMGSLKTVPPRMFRIYHYQRLDPPSRGSVTHSTVRTPPHLFELEFLYSSFVGGDRGALDTDRVLLDSLGRVDSDLIVCLSVKVQSAMLPLIMARTHGISALHT